MCYKISYSQTDFRGIHSDYEHQLFVELYSDITETFPGRTRTVFVFQQNSCLQKGLTLKEKYTLDSSCLSLLTLLLKMNQIGKGTRS